MAALLGIVPAALRALEEGRVFRTVVSWALRIQAVLTGLLAIVGIVGVLRIGFAARGVEGTLAGLVIALALAVMAVIVIQILLHRADTIRSFPESPYALIPIVSVLLRLYGEIFAAYFAIVAVGAALASLFASGLTRLMLSQIPLPGVGGAGGLLGALVLLATGLAAAFSALVIAYFLAEWIMLLADVARDVHRMAGSVTPVLPRDAAPAPTGMASPHVPRATS